MQIMNNPGRELLIFDRDLVAERDYWISKLSLAPTPAYLKSDFPRSGNVSTERETVELFVSGELYQKLTKVTGGSGFLTYVILMSALKVCLYKYTGSEYVGVGSPSLKDSEDGESEGNVV